MKHFISESAKEDRWVRRVRALSYFLITAAGFLLVLSPLLDDFYPPVARVMAVFIAVGGLTSFLGAVTGRWVGEFVGLPLLASSFVVFAFLTTDGTFEIAPYIAAANFSLLTGFGVAATSRWLDSLRSYRLAMHLAKNPPEEMISGE